MAGDNETILPGDFIMFHSGEFHIAAGSRVTRCGTSYTWNLVGRHLPSHTSPGNVCKKCDSQR